MPAGLIVSIQHSPAQNLSVLLYLTHISLFQFKNYQQSAFSFSERIIGISGRNGIGKTNLLDAIYYCCFTRSYFTKTAIQNVMAGKQGFRLEAAFNLNGEAAAVTGVLRENGRKEFSLNGEPYARFSDHIGRFPCIMIAPDDVQTLTGGSEERRQFLDTLLCQIEHSYLLRLISYNKLLLQRNSLLKRFAEQGRADENLLQVLDEQIAGPGQSIFEQRTAFLKEFIPRLQRFYRLISGASYEVEITYSSPLQEGNFKQLLLAAREKDRILQRTTTGIHKDDLLLNMHQSPFRNIASQGQRKSLLFAFKLAAFEVLKEVKGFPPLLLLDDIFEKLDEQRMQNLLGWVCGENNGQLFITDTHEDRLRQYLAQFSSTRFMQLS